METEAIAIDPVCGMKVKVATAKNTTQHDGHTYYFCNPKCLAKFSGDPDRYLRPQPAEALPPQAPPGTVFTCPMHPEVRQVGPGSCPECGMALEPAEVSLDQGPNEELVDFTRRLWIGGALAVPVVILDMGGHVFGLHSSATTRWIELAFATPVVLWAGWPFFVRGVQSVRRWALNMFTLIALGTGTAWLYSVFITIKGTGDVYFESAALIVVLTLLGQVLELRARAATAGATITGEPMPVAKEAGARVIAGTVNQSGSFVMKAEKVGADTMLSRIVKLVSEAQRSRAPIQRLADSVAGWFVPLVVTCALLAAAAWTIWGPEPRFTHALLAAVAVLIIACPCALGLATPMSIMVGVGRGAALGILIRNAEALERLEKVDTLVIDKTGTLTVGRPEIAEVTGGMETMRLAASLERGSEHPIAAAINSFARDRNLKPAPVTDFKNHAGRGVSGTVDGKSLLLGNARLLKENGVDLGTFNRPVMLAVDGKLAGTITFEDPIKETTPAALADLRKDGVRIVMLTGDNRHTAEKVANQLGIEEFEAEVLPEEKAKAVARLKAEGRIVAMAGDGINDAPALAAADVGIAMGTGTDIAIESAGVTLVKGDLAAIVRARHLSRATMANIRQNLFFAFVYNAAGVPIAAGVLYPVIGLLLSPIVAAAAMALSSVSVVGNALRLRKSAI
jgi:Cu+-exporting ATPase